MSRDDLKITGLLSFVDGDNFILILATNPSLSTGEHQFPTDATFTIHIDYDSMVELNSTSNNQLYGGSLPQPKAQSHQRRYQHWNSI